MEVLITFCSQCHKYVGGDGNVHVFEECIFA